MALDTYADLQASVASWVERGDLTARIPDFISLAEAAMNRRLRTREADGRSIATVASEFVALPLDFSEAGSVRIRLNSSDPWSLVDPSTNDAISRNATSALSRPFLYAVVGSEMRFAPAPNASYQAELEYFSKVPALSDANPTNWVLTNHPDAYLYGTLLHVAPYLRDADMIKVWGGLSETAIVQMLAERRQRGGKLRTETDYMPRTRSTFNINTGM